MDQRAQQYFQAVSFTIQSMLHVLMFTENLHNSIQFNLFRNPQIHYSQTVQFYIYIYIYIYTHTHTHRVILLILKREKTVSHRINILL
jgi:hypothetical protein